MKLKTEKLEIKEVQPISAYTPCTRRSDNICRKTGTDKDKRGNRRHRHRPRRPKPKIDFTEDALDFEYNLLKQYVTDQGRTSCRENTPACPRITSAVTTAIKRARCS